MKKPARPGKAFWIWLCVSAGIILLSFVSRVINASPFGKYSFESFMHDLFFALWPVVLFSVIYLVVLTERKKRKQAAERQAAAKEAAEKRAEEKKAAQREAAAKAASMKKAAERQASAKEAAEKKTGAAEGGSDSSSRFGGKLKDFIRSRTPGDLSRPDACEPLLKSLLTVIPQAEAAISGASAGSAAVPVGRALAELKPEDVGEQIAEAKDDALADTYILLNEYAERLIRANRKHHDAALEVPGKALQSARDMAAEELIRRFGDAHKDPVQPAVGQGQNAWKHFAGIEKPLKDLLECYRLPSDTAEGCAHYRDIVLRVGIGLMTRGDTAAAAEWIRSAPDDRLRGVHDLLNSLLRELPGMQPALQGAEWPDSLRKARNSFTEELHRRQEAARQAAAKQADANRYMEDPALKAFKNKYFAMLQPHFKKGRDAKPVVETLKACYRMPKEAIDCIISRNDFIVKTGTALNKYGNAETAAEWMRSASDGQLLDLFLMLDNILFDGPSSLPAFNDRFWESFAAARSLVMAELERRYGIVLDRFRVSDAGYACALSYILFTDAYEARLYDLKGKWLPEGCNMARFRLTEEEFEEAKNRPADDVCFSDKSEQLFLSLLTNRPGDRLAEMAQLICVEVKPENDPGQTVNRIMANKALPKTDTGIETSDDHAYEKYIRAREAAALHAIETAEKVYVPFCRANWAEVPLMTNEEGCAVVFDSVERAQKMLAGNDFGSGVAVRPLSPEEFRARVKTWNRYGVERLLLNPGQEGIRGFVNRGSLLSGDEGKEQVCNAGLLGNILQLRQFNTNPEHPECRACAQAARDRIIRALYHAVFLVPELFDDDTKVTPEPLVAATRSAAALLTEKEILRRFGNPFAAFSGRNPDDGGNEAGPEAGAGVEVHFENDGKVFTCTQSKDGRLQLTAPDGKPAYSMDPSLFFGGGEKYRFAGAEEAAVYEGKNAQLCTLQTHSGDCFVCGFTDFEYLERMQSLFPNGYRLYARTFEEIIPGASETSLTSDGKIVPVTGLVINPGPHELRLNRQALSEIARANEQDKRE